MHISVADVFCWMACTGVSVPICMPTAPSQHNSRQVDHMLHAASPLVAKSCYRTVLGLSSRLQRAAEHLLHMSGADGQYRQMVV